MRKPHRSNDAIRMGLAAALLSPVLDAVSATAANSAGSANAASSASSAIPSDPLSR